MLLAFYPGNDVRNNSPTLEPTLPPSYDASGAIERVKGRQGRRGHRRAWLARRVRRLHYVRKLLLTGQPALAERLANWGLLNKAALRPVPMVEGVPVDYWVYAQAPATGVAGGLAAHRALARRHCAMRWQPTAPASW